jgi:6-phosphogluconolactonase
VATPFRRLKAEVVVTDDPAGAAAERLAAAAGGHLALSGGSTPRAAYELAARSGTDWSSTTFWWGDERCVPPDHEHSNYRMTSEAWLDHVDTGPVHRIKGELGFEEGAEDLEGMLRAEFGDGIPELDLVICGLGPDVHTASLFPGDAALGERDRLAVGVETPGMPPLVSRVTLTLPVLNAGREVVFLVAGEDKTEAVHRAFAGAPDPGAPASLVEADAIILDPAAAQGLP